MSGQQTHLKNLVLSGTLTVTGAQTFTGATALSSTLAVTGATTLSSTLAVTGAATLASTLAVTGAVTMSSTLASGAHTITGALSVSTTSTLTGVVTAAAANVITHANTGLKVLDTGGDHTVSIVPAGDEAANRILSIPLLGGADTINTLGTAQAVTGVKTFNDGSALVKCGTGSGTRNPSGVISITTTAVATGADTNETDAASYTLPANSLSANGKGVRVKAWGTTAGNGNNKTLQFYFGGTSVYTTGAVAANAKNWFVEATIIRTGAGAQDIAINGHFNGSIIVASNITTAAKDETATQVIKFTLTNGSSSASDIVLEGATIEFLA